MSRKIYLPWSDPFLGRMWMPEKTNAFYDFTRDHGGKVLDLAANYKTRTLTNLCGEGNFDSDAGWAAPAATLSVASNTLTITGSGVDGNPDARYDTTTATANGKVVYCKATVKVTNNSCLHITLRARGLSGGSSFAVATQMSPAQNTIYTISGVATFDATHSGNIQFMIRHTYADAATANGKVMDVQSFIAYDLTAAVAVDTAANITQLLQDNNIVYHDGAQTMRYGNYLTNSGATDYGHSRYFDGSDDYMAGMNSPAVDITAAPLAVFATVKASNVGTWYGYIVCKNTSALGDIQYGLYVDSAGIIGAALEKALKAQSGSDAIKRNEWSDVGYIWDGTNITTYCNLRTVSADSGGTYSGALTSQPYFRICRRETASTYFKGWMDNLCIYTTGDFKAILDHRRWLMRRKGLLA